MRATTLSQFAFASGTMMRGKSQRVWGRLGQAKFSSEGRLVSGAGWSCGQRGGFGSDVDFWLCGSGPVVPP